MFRNALLNAVVVAGHPISLASVSDDNGIIGMEDLAIADVPSYSNTGRPASTNERHLLLLAIRHSTHPFNPSYTRPPCVFWFSLAS